MRSSRLLVGIILFPLLVMVERMASFGVKTILPQLIIAAPSQGGLGSSSTELSTALTLLAGIGLFTPLVGGATAMAVGARRLLVLGAALSVIAYAALAFVTPGSLTMIVLLVGLAGGLFFPNLYAVVAEQLAEARPMTLAALFAGLSVAVDIGSFCGPFSLLLLGIGGSLSSSGFILCMFLAAVSMALVAGAMSIAFALDREPTTPRPAVPKPVSSLLLLAAVTAPLCLIANLQDAPSPSAPGFLATFALQSAVSAGVQLLVLAAFITLAVVGSRAPLLLPVGGGLLVSALGGALSLGGFYTLVPVLAHLGACIVWPPTMAMIAAVAPRRTTPVVFALWFTSQRLLSSLTGMGGAGVPAWIVALGTMGCVVGGAALVVRGRSLDASRFSAPVAAPGGP